jgi:antitoxin HicB
MIESTDRASIEKYMKVPYTISIVRADDGYVAKVEELPGCVTQAETRTEALEAIDDAMMLWLESAVTQELGIPEPRSQKD